MKTMESDLLPDHENQYDSELIKISAKLGFYCPQRSYREVIYLFLGTLLPAAKLVVKSKHSGL